MVMEVNPDSSGLSVSKTYSVYWIHVLWSLLLITKMMMTTTTKLKM